MSAAALVYPILCYNGASVREDGPIEYADAAVRQQHDRGYKHLLSSKLVFVELLRSLVRRGWVEHIDETELIKVDKSFILPDFKGKEADLVYRMKLKDRDVIFYMLIELQSSVDHLMPWRLLQYQVEIWRQVLRDSGSERRNGSGFRLLVIIPLVLYNGQAPWTAPLLFRDLLHGEQSFADEALLNFSYFLLDVQRYAEEDLEKLSNMIGAVFLIDRSARFKLEELIRLFRKLAPTIDQLSQAQREHFAVWLEQMLRRMATTKEKAEEIKHIAADIRTKGMSGMISNFEKNLEWIKEQGIEQGRIIGIETAALNMLREGIDISIIAKVTQLPLAKLQQLQAELT